MKKLIDAEELIKRCRDKASPLDIISKGYRNVNVLSVGEINRIVDGMPTADVEPARKWIPCSERLPEKRQDVLLLFKSNMAVGFWTEDWGCKSWNVNSDDGFFNNCDAVPICWMPLPESPKTQGGESNESDQQSAG